METIAPIIGSLGFVVLGIGLILFIPIASFKPRRPLAKKLAIGGGAAFVLALILTPSSTGESPAAAPTASFSAQPKAAPTQATVSPADSSTTAAEEQQSNPSVGLFGPQANAARSGQQYLEMSGFSRDGLIDQLSSNSGDGYDVDDATVAVDSLNADWNEQAARSAKQYLDMSGFSCNGLIEQLSSDSGDKYSKAQARYGAQQAGAC